MINRENYIKNIALNLNLLEKNIESRGLLSLRDINIISENFYRDLLNKVYNLKLENLNYSTPNQDSIDLGDKNARKSFQITSSVTREKIIKSITGFEKYLNDYDTLFIFFILPKKNIAKKSGKISEFESTFGFSSDIHILDNTDILKEINNLSTEKIKDIEDFIMQELSNSPIKNSQNMEDLDKYLDNWKSFIVNSTILLNEKEIKGYNISKVICQEIRKKLEPEVVMLGRQILCDKYKEIDIELFFSHLYMSNPTMSLFFMKDENNAINKFIAEMDNRAENERWDYIKNYVGSVGYEGKDARFALYAIGSINFYKINYNNDDSIARKHLYTIAINRIYQDYDYFLDGYINQISNILEILSNIPNPERYVKAIQHNFTSKFDLLLLLYLLLADKVRPEIIHLIKKWVNFSTLESGVAEYMIDHPDEKIIKSEIDNALKLEN